MIIDELKNISKYAGLGENFKTAIDYLKSADLSQLPLGKTPIDGDEVFAVKSDNVMDKDDMFWEAHQKYADIQVIVEGSERFGYGTATLGEYDESRDLYGCADADWFEFVRGVGQFVIFLPLEPHSPGNYIKKGDTNVKVVIKVKCN